MATYQIVNFMLIIQSRVFSTSCILTLFTLATGCDGVTSPDTGALEGGGSPDTTAPQVSIVSPASTTIQSSPQTITLQGQASDETGVSTITASINNGDEFPLTLINSSFSENIVLAEDNNDITVTVTDTSANAQSARVSINYVAEGVFQTTFGGDVNPVDAIPDGFVTRDTGSHDGGFALARASDGSLFSAGFARTNGGSGDYDMVLWKITPTGSFDTGFGSNGMVFLDDPKSSVGNAGSTADYARDVTVDNAGNVLLVGKADNDMVIARFNPTDGALDSAFGGDINPADGTPDGFVVLDVSAAGSADDATAVTVDAENNVYVAGTSDDDIYVLKFTSAGVLDTTFSASNGFVSHDSGGVDKGLDMAFDQAGKLVVLGSTGGAVWLWRMDSDGNDDDSFGVSGKTTGPSAYTVSQMAIDSSNNIVVTGSTTPGIGDSDMTLWRFDEAGVLDIGFGDGDGTEIFVGIDPDEKDYGFDVTFDAAENVLVTGSMYTDVVNKSNMAVWRYSSAGVLDTTFATNGYLLNTGAAAAGGTSNLDRGFGVLVDPVGNILISGDGQSGSTGADIVVWKLK